VRKRRRTLFSVRGRSEGWFSPWILLSTYPGGAREFGDLSKHSPGRVLHASCSDLPRSRSDK